MPNDLIIFSGSLFNKYGHVAIISAVTKNEIEIIQQNPGPFGKSRETISLNYTNNKWIIDNDRVLGWLRNPEGVALLMPDNHFGSDLVLLCKISEDGVTFDHNLVISCQAKWQDTDNIKALEAIKTIQPSLIYCVKVCSLEIRGPGI